VMWRWRLGWCGGYSGGGDGGLGGWRVGMGLRVWPALLTRGVKRVMGCYVEERF
jgi:hypothetical protein